MRKSKNKFNLSKRYRRLGILAGLIIIVVAVLELTNTTHLFHKESVPPFIPAHTNSGTPLSSANPNNTSSNNPSSTNGSSNTPTADETNHTLIAPFGNFVSNHFPGQNSSPTTESSVCNTSPGATCYIKFTNTDSNQTTQLAPQVTDAHGSTSWYWDIHKDAHLFSGQWEVTALATLGSQVKSTEDPLKLIVQ